MSKPRVFTKEISMENRIHIPRALYDEITKEDPFLPLQDVSEDDLWLKVKNYFESKEGLGRLLDFVIHHTPEFE